MKSRLICAIIVTLMLLTGLAGCLDEDDGERADGTPGAPGVSWKDVVAVKRATLVGFDKESTTDDYAYMAAVPASVFYDSRSDNIYASPVLYYEQPFSGAQDEASLNAEDGIGYFLEDYSVWADGEPVLLEAINMDESAASGLQDEYGFANLATISEGSAAGVAAKIAERNWEYSDKAVVAIIDDNVPDISDTSSGTVDGTLKTAPVKVGHFQGRKEPDPVVPTFHDFTVDRPYSYITAYMTWGEDWNPLADITERGKDPDLQLYAWDLGDSGAQVAASEEWNVLSGASEEIGTFAYTTGSWSAAVTYMPTESYDEDGQPLRDRPEFPKGPDGIAVGRGGTPVQPAVSVDTGDGAQGGTGAWRPAADGSRLSVDALPGPLSSVVEYDIEYTMYPGVDVELPEDTPYGVTSASFELTWADPDCTLGLLIRGPSGAEIGRALADSTSQTMELAQLGEDRYTASVIDLTGGEEGSIDFTVRYEWTSTLPRSYGDSLSSAAQGAVLASVENAPLLYALADGVPGSTLSALDTLGVKKVYLMDIGGHGGSGIVEELEDHRSTLQTGLNVQRIGDFRTAASMIQERTGQYEIVFSSISPYSYWKIAVRQPDGEWPGATAAGPAAYIAAHHGTSVIFLENHPEISPAAAWHTVAWLEEAPGRSPPSVGCMVLEGHTVYDFIDDIGLDGPAKEPMVTVAGQFDIGITFDRSLVGPALPGRIMGTPVDQAQWVSRSALYQAMIHANPAVDPTLDPHDGSRIMGSASTRTAGVLTITREEVEVTTTYPVLNTWVSFQHKFNELGAEYWGTPYTSARGVTPFITPSDHPLDPNGRYPDMTSSEVIPMYFEAAGYDNVFTTSTSTSFENLNRGAILWFEVMHGGSSRSGVVGFWEDSQRESNPWRGYEENVLYLRGATDDPDVVTMNKHIGLDAQPSTGPRLPNGVIPETHDGIIIALAQQEQTNYVDGYMFDEYMDNIHSVGFSAGSCLIADTYLHLSMVRHGSVFQVIDPWLTSWYSAMAMNLFARGLNDGYTVGQAYEEGISHVGIEYLMDGWWWDIFENVVFFGDPNLKPFVPNLAWEKPVGLKGGKVVSGHSPYGAGEHPNTIEDTTLLELGVLAGAVIGVAMVAVVYRRWRKGQSLGMKRWMRRRD